MRRCLEEGVAVALGTDVSGGAAPSMLSAVREAQGVEHGVARRAPAATVWRARGQAVRAALVRRGLLARHRRRRARARRRRLTGDFGDGAAFDAVVVDPDASGSPIGVRGRAAARAFQKWIQLGDDRNTAGVYVNVLVKSVTRPKRLRAAPRR